VFSAALLLSIFSVIAMISASATLNPALAWRQALWAGVGLLASLGASRIPLSRWMDLAVVVYGVTVAVLAFVLIGGTTRLGATRWISLFGLSVQPTEFAKLATVLWLARYLMGQPAPLAARTVWISLGVVGLPMLLIFKQPDLGSATILLAIWAGMVWAAGIGKRQLMALGGVGAGLLPIAWRLLKPYQRERLLAFLDPHADPLGVGYTIIQSQIAIGSGRLTGRGWFAGTQNQLNFLPERHSDFLFSVIGEEWGFIGCLLVIAAFGVLLFGILRMAIRHTSPNGALLAVGVFSWFSYQAVVNMGMVMGLLPVVGVPLPLMSYGGSSMAIIWVALGMLQRVAQEDR
jgi:rod shape determining protein RodA